MLEGQVREKQWLRGAGGEKEGGLEGRGGGSVRVRWGYGLSDILALQTNRRYTILVITAGL